MGRTAAALRSQRSRLEPRDRRMAHIVGASDLDKRLADVAPFKRLTLLVRRELGPTAELYATRFGPCAALPGTGADQITFELGEASEHGQQEAPVRRGRVSPSIPQRAEARTLAGDRREGVEKIAG